MYTRMPALIRLPASLLLAALLALLAAGTAMAHGHEVVGPYEVVIGFRTEPAVQGEPNGLDLRVKHHETGAPVLGLEETLQAEVRFGGATMPLKLRPRSGQEGSYTADLLPTEAGDYTFRIFGTIAGTPADLTLTSGHHSFSPVVTRASLAFPAPEPSPAELAAVAAGAQRQAQIALILGGTGALLGLVGLSAALVVFRARRERPAPAARHVST
jgi:hypothetical protein